MQDVLKFCPNCGQPIKPTDDFCPNCGFDLRKARLEAQSTQEPRLLPRHQKQLSLRQLLLQPSQRSNKYINAGAGHGSLLVRLSFF